ncbi:MAG TPA: class I SAM-dependent methyltransferase [Chitinophagaceae bacterium]|nr:class I SAM-dependent methyltransferase [Chitinophagaceae bacterium]
MAQKEWFKQWFNSPYYDMLYFRHNADEAKAFVELLLQHLRPAQGSRILDVACGKGRYSRLLSEMNFDVTGIDLSADAIEHAKQFETDSLHFFQHDMRLPFMINYFNYAFNFFTSFGYFATQREHDNAIRTIAQSLQQNGIFVIDYLNVHYAEDHLVKNEKKKIDDTVFHLSRWHNDEHFFKQIQIDESNRVKHLFTEKVSKFTLGDFTDMFAYQDMQVQDVFGDYTLGHYNVRKSPRMIIVAQKKRH